MDAELQQLSVDDVTQCEDRIVSQWTEVSADEQSQLCEQIDEILRPLGYETSLVVIRRANSIALYFICMTLLAVTSLRDLWRSEQLRDIVQSLLTFVSAIQKVRVKRLTWPVADYKRCFQFFSSVRGTCQRPSHELFAFLQYKLCTTGFHTVLSCIHLFRLGQWVID